ncbi:hypothetical protein [Microbacterium sp. T32]|uniref:hypothetical protein n=1 Tax=Microbacterium sp. T32 TaxID=1776083 RepID=UPI000A408816|nr:hypothetical protein [Microbacterium sp. T32]
MTLPATRERTAARAQMLLHKWGIDPAEVSVDNLNHEGYWRLARNTVHASLLPPRLADRRYERIWTRWPEDFPADEFLELIPLSHR